MSATPKHTSQTPVKSSATPFDTKQSDVDGDELDTVEETPERDDHGHDVVDARLLRLEEAVFGANVAPDLSLVDNDRK